MQDGHLPPDLAEPAPQAPSLHDTMAAIMRRIRDECGTTRVMFAMLDRERTHLRSRMALGGGKGDALRHLDVRLEDKNLFSLLMTKPQSVWLDRGNARKFQAYLPRSLRPVCGPEGAYRMSIYVQERPLGLL